MFIFIWAPCHARLSLWRVIKMTPTNCKCLQKCSLASLGQSVKIKGHAFPSICLFVVAFLFFDSTFWVRSNVMFCCFFPVRGTDNMSACLGENLFKVRFRFYLYQLVIELLSWGLDGKMPLQFIPAARGAHLFSHCAAVCQLFTFLFKGFLMGTPRIIYVCVWRGMILYFHLL